MTTSTRNKRLLVTAGWAIGRRVQFEGFAHGNRWTAINHISSSASLLTGQPGEGDVIINLDGTILCAYWRNLNPMPCRVVIVEADPAPDFEELESPKDLNKIAQLDQCFIPHYVHRRRLKSWVRKTAEPYGEFVWWHFCQRTACLVLGVDSPNRARNQLCRSH